MYSAGKGAGLRPHNTKFDALDVDKFLGVFFSEAHVNFVLTVCSQRIIIPVELVPVETTEKPVLTAKHLQAVYYTYMLPQSRAAILPISKDSDNEFPKRARKSGFAEALLHCVPKSGHTLTARGRD